MPRPVNMRATNHYPKTQNDQSYEAFGYAARHSSRPTYPEPPKPKAQPRHPDIEATVIGRHCSTILRRCWHVIKNWKFAARQVRNP